MITQKSDLWKYKETILYDIGVKKMSAKEIIRELKMVLKKTKISRKAMKEDIKAMNKDDIRLTCEMTAVKGFTSGNMNSKQHYFSESVYSILNRIHFGLAHTVGRISPWKFLFTPSGIYKEEKPKRKHPVIKIMEKERDEIWEYV